MMVSRRVVAVVTALVFAVSTAAIAQQKPAPQNQQKRSKQEQAEIEQLVKLVDSVIAGQPAPTDVQMSITPFFLKSQEQRTFVPFVLDVKGAPAADAALLVRVVNPEAYAAAKDKRKFEFPWEDIHFVPSAQLAAGNVRLNRVFMAAPGTYDVYIAMKERLPEKPQKGQVAKVGVLKQTVTVPDFWSGEMQTSSILVTDQVNALKAPVTAEEARERPFVFGAQELVPAVDMEFKKSEELSVFFQVYNPSLDAKGMPDLVLEYNFHRKEGDAEKFFNKTNPQTVNASVLPPNFDPKVYPVPGGITVPLTSFAEGQYRLEIKIIDKAANKTVTRDVNFKVTS